MLLARKLLALCKPSLVCLKQLSCEIGHFRSNGRSLVLGQVVVFDAKGAHYAFDNSLHH
ncbi:MAG: hypothetical protein JSS22_08720 [Proteobacteria bacterium]|nr:hypothetical protein [Pseudomonadota bacterium]